MESVEPSANLAGLPGASSQAVAPRSPGRAREWAFALMAAIIVGLVSWIAGERAVDAFRPRLFLVQVLGQTSMQPTYRSKNSADYKNAVLTHAIYGCVMGLVMGVAGGMAGRSLSSGLIVALGAQAAGAVVGALASMALLPLFFRHSVPDLNDLLTPILIHGCIWAAIGAVGAGAFAYAAGRPWRLVPLAVSDACVGAGLASVIYHLLSAELFPDSKSIDPVATSPAVRLLAVSLLAGLVAAGAARGTCVGSGRALKKHVGTGEL
jgi:hypothetical protein